MFLLPPGGGGILVHHRVTPSIKYTSTHSNTWVDRSRVRVKCLDQEHNTMSLVRVCTSTPLDTELSTLTMRLMYLHRGVRQRVNHSLDDGFSKV